MINVWNDRKWKDSKGLCVGIDLGTSNSCVAIWRNKNAEVIPCEKRKLTIPSIGTFTIRKGEKHARLGNHVNESSSSSSNVNDAFLVEISHAKRLLGVSNPSKKDLKYMSDLAGCPVQQRKTRSDIDTSNVELCPSSTHCSIMPEEVSASILTRLKRCVEVKFNKEVTNAVVTVPAYFDHRQRSATRVAAEMAGFQDVELLSEPVAAAMAYGLFVAGSKDVLVVDFGGGTLDVSALHIEDGGKFRVLSTSGDTNLGGADVDRTLLAYLQERDCKQYEVLDIDFAKKCEQAKIELSQSKETEILLMLDEKQYKIRLTRKELETSCDSIFRKCVEVVKTCMNTAMISRVDEIVLVGGSTRIPELRRRVRNCLNLSKELCHSADETAVAEGAAIRACILSDADSESVLKDVLMLDVLPISLGVKCDETGAMTVVIPRNSTLPCKKSRSFCTSEDMQKGVSVQVYEGNDLKCAENNIFVGQFDFFIPESRRGPRGEVVVSVTFEINESGVVRVSSDHDDLESDTDSTQIFCLTVFCVLLFSLYIFFKLYFVDEFARGGGVGVVGSSSSSSSDHHYDL